MNKNLGIVIIEQHEESTIHFNFLFVPNTGIDPKDMIIALLVYLQEKVKRDERSSH